MDDQKDTTGGAAGRTITTERPPEAIRDATAARQLPALYDALGAARDLLAKLGGDHLNVHTVHFNIGGDDATHTVESKESFAELLRKDVAAKVTAIEDKIRGLGFNPGDAAK